MTTLTPHGVIVMPGGSPAQQATSPLLFSTTLSHTLTILSALSSRSTRSLLWRYAHPYRTLCAYRF